MPEHTPQRFLRAGRGELRKVATLPILALFVVGLGVLWQDLGRTTAFAASQTPIAVAATNEQRAEVRAACSAQPASEACELARLDGEINRWFAPNGVAAGRIAASLDTFPGLLMFVSRQAATGLGALLLAAFVGLHISGEHANRTLEGSVLRTGRARCWSTKVASTVLAAWAAIVAATAVLFVLRPTFTEPVRVPVEASGFDALDGPMRTLAPDPTWSSWGSALTTLLVALGVVAALGVAFATVACVVRSPIGTAVLLAAPVIGAFALAQHGHDALVGHRALASVLGLDDGAYGIVDSRLVVVAGRPESIYDHVVAPAPGTGGAVLLATVWLVVVVAGRRAFLASRLR